MPELPEVETVVRGLRPRIVDTCIQRLEIRRVAAGGILRGSLWTFRRMLLGRRIWKVHRRGKYILLHMTRSGGDDSLVWIIHLGMTGQLYACKAAAERLKHTHVVAWLSSGEQLRYCDPRRFGRMLIVPRNDLSAFLNGRLGPEPLRVGFSHFARLFEGRWLPVKNFLLNQQRLGGIGNIYANEALHLAGIHPATPAASLTQAQRRRLFRSLQDVLREAIAGQGTTVSDYRNADGVPGDYQNSLRVYDREGDPCLRCGTAIERIVLSGRSAHFCPACQRLGGVPWPKRVKSRRR